MLIELQQKTNMGNDKLNKVLRRSPGEEQKQSLQEFSQYLRRKNILETKLFKKKYERVAKHISGMPKSEG